MTQNTGRVKSGSKEKEETAFEKLKEKLNIEGYQSPVDYYFEESNFTEILSFLSSYLLDYDFDFNNMFDKHIGFGSKESSCHGIQLKLESTVEISFSVKNKLTVSDAHKFVEVHAEEEVNFTETHLGKDNGYSNLKMSFIFVGCKLDKVLCGFHGSNRSLKFTMTDIFLCEFSRFKLDGPIQNHYK